MVSRLLCLAIAWDGRVSFKLRKILLSPAHPSIPSSNFLAQSSFMSSPKSSSGKLQTPLMLYENHRLNILFSGSSTCHDCNITIVYSLNCRPYVRILCRLYGRKTTRAVPSDTLVALYTLRVRYGKCPYNSRKMYGHNRIRLRWPVTSPSNRPENKLYHISRPGLKLEGCYRAVPAVSDLSMKLEIHRPTPQVYMLQVFQVIALA